MQEDFAETLYNEKYALTMLSKIPPDMAPLRHPPGFYFGRLDIEPGQQHSPKKPRSLPGHPRAWALTSGRLFLHTSHSRAFRGR